MKTVSLSLLLIFISLNLEAHENWIKIDSSNQNQTPKPNLKLDLNLSQIEPIGKMIKNATAIKQLIDDYEKVKPTSSDKNWFTLNYKDAN